MSYVPRAREVIDLEIQGLAKVREGLGKNFDAAVKLILECLAEGGKVVVTGVGKNLLIGQKISATLASTGATSVVLNPLQAMHGDLGILNPQDVLLALSYSGESEEIMLLVPVVKRLGLRIVALTGNAKSSLASHSDTVIAVAVDREACPFNMAPTASTTATLAVGDALAMVLLEARGFQKDDYAKLHPGGTIGRALLLRVSDLMRSGSRLAAVKQNATIKEALVAMTHARSGSAAVIDEDRRVLGIFTDGDLRRHVAEHNNFLDVPIENLMTPSPFTVHADRLAVDVVRLFEKHNIDDILVVDSEKRLVGAVDIQDLPKVKLM